MLDKSPEILALLEGVPRAPTDEKTRAEMGELCAFCVIAFGGVYYSVGA